MESLFHVWLISAPLFNNLLKRAVQWSFEKIKETLKSAEVLGHYNPDVPLGLVCDASVMGIGAVIYHNYEDRIESPIAYASKTLSDAELKYSQIEREALVSFLGSKSFISSCMEGHFHS